MMIRPARDADLDPIARIYEEVLDQEDARPVSYTNWQAGAGQSHPGTPPVRPLRRHSLGVGGGGAVCGCVNLNGVQLPEYSQIPWSIPAAPEEVGVIHTLVIRPSLSGRGLARRLVDFCEEELRRQGKRTVRLDTYEATSRPTPCTPGWGTASPGPATSSSRTFSPRYSTAMKKPCDPAFSA